MDIFSSCFTLREVIIVVKRVHFFFVNSANLVEGNILLSSQSVDSIKTYKENIKEMLLKRNNGRI